MIQKSFKTRAGEWLHSLAKQRLYLIRANKSGGDIARKRMLCEQILNNMPNILSDHSMALYFQNNKDRFQYLIPKCQSNLHIKERELRDLSYEATEICINHKIKTSSCQTN